MALQRVAHMLMGFAALTALGSAAGGELHEQIERAAQQNFAEYLDALRIPNVPAKPADIQRNADFLTRAFERRGFDVRLVTNPAGRPVALAELAPRQGLPTLLFYFHYDGQPVIAAEWSQADPFAPVVRRRDAAGEWQDVGADTLQARPLDPELRVFARSASDDKAPIMMLLTAFDVLAAQARGARLQPQSDARRRGGDRVAEPRGHGGVRSCGIHGRRARDSRRAASTHPAARRSCSAIAALHTATLTVFGPRAPLHSGHYGNYAPNPALRLAALLASMKDDDGRVLIPGFYDGVRLTDADRITLRRRRRRRGRAARTHRHRARRECRRELSGVAAVSVVERARHGGRRRRRRWRRTWCRARPSRRSTCARRPRRTGSTSTSSCARTSSAPVITSSTASPPTPSARNSTSSRASRSVRRQAAMRMPMDSAVGRWANAALRAPTAPQPGETPVQIRMMGGTVPTDVLIDALQTAVRARADGQRRQQPARREREPADRPLRQRHRDALQSPDDAVPALIVRTSRARLSGCRIQTAWAFSWRGFPQEHTEQPAA